MICVEVEKFVDEIMNLMKEDSISHFDYDERMVPLSDIRDNLLEKLKELQKEK